MSRQRRLPLARRAPDSAAPPGDSDDQPARFHRGHRPEPVPAGRRARRQRGRHRDRGRVRRRRRRQGRRAAAAGGSAEIIIVDCSGSMDYPQPRSSRRAPPRRPRWTCSGTARGSRSSRARSPPGPSTRRTGRWRSRMTAPRTEAKRAVRGLRANGGTAIGQWLRLAHRIFQSCPATLRHAILLTDGKNQHETPERARRGDRAVRGRVPLRLPWRRHRLGGRASCARSPPRCSAPSTSCPTRRGWRPTSRR